MAEINRKNDEMTKRLTETMNKENHVEDKECVKGRKKKKD